LNGSNWLDLRRTSCACACARSYWMEFALPFRVTLLNERTSTRCGRLARI
jgi:hypothetical protein